MERQKVIERCLTCGHIDGDYCSIYLQPDKQWTRILGCAIRTHNKVVQVEDNKQLNPIKASKRGIKKH